MATYYVSNIGSDSYNGQSGTFTSGSTGPWLSLSKVNASTFAAGDSVLFRSGDTFFGSLVISNSGSSGSSVLYSRYGTGSKPVITGLSTLSGWTNSGSVYSAPLTYGSRINIVTFNGVQKWMGRTAGWSTMSSFTSTGGDFPSVAITGNLPSSPNFVGGEAVVKVFEWMINPGLITAHSGSVLTYNSPNQFVPQAASGFGYFVQNHLATLTTQDEWFYDTAANSMKIYSSSTPTNIKAATIANIITLNSKNYITFDNLDVQGANTSCFNLVGGSGITIQDCNISLAGLDGIHSTFSTGLFVNNNTISWCNNEGIRIESASNPVVTFNNVSNIATFEGAGKDNNGAMNGMRVAGSNSIVSENRISNVGYCGINVSGNNFFVSKNYITNYCLLVSDGGGVYVSDEGTTGKVIEDNICMYGYGNSAGTPYTNSFATFGIYIDEASDNITINRNTMAFNGQGAQGGGGLYNHKGHNLTITNNIFFNNVKTQFRIDQDYPFVIGDVTQPIQYVRNITFTGNTVFSTDTGNYLYHLYSTPSPDYDIDKFFNSLNNNILAKPLGSTDLVHTYNRGTTVDTGYTLSQWKAFKNTYDQNSVVAPTAFNTVTPRFEYNDTNVDKVVSLDGTYLDTASNSYSGSVTIPAYSSKILAKTSSIIEGYIAVVGLRVLLV